MNGKTKILTFSGFKLTFAKNQIKQSIKKNDYDSLCFWSAELHISKHIMSWLSELIVFSSKNIYTSNSRLSLFILKIKNDFETIFKQKTNLKARQGICFLNGVVLFSPKNIELTSPKIPYNDAQKKTIIRQIDSKMVHPFVSRIRKPGDKLFVLKLCSMLAESILQYNNQHTAHILGFFIEFEKNNKKAFICNSRPYKGMNTKFYQRYELLIFDLLVSIAKKRKLPIKNRLCKNDTIPDVSDNEIANIMITNRVLWIFNTNHTTASNNFFIILNSVNLLCNRNLNLKLPVIHNQNKIEKGLQFIDGLYLDIFKAKQNT
jgi:hypothetical protein